MATVGSPGILRLLKEMVDPSANITDAIRELSSPHNNTIVILRSIIRPEADSPSTIERLREAHTRGFLLDALKHLNDNRTCQFETPLPSSAKQTSVDPTPKPNPSKIVSDLLGQYAALNASLKEAEKQLAELHTPVECHYVYCREISDGMPEQHYAIGWQKIGIEWKLCHGVFDARYPGDCEWRPLIECPVDVRVEAAGGYGELRDMLLTEANSFADEVRKANAELSLLLNKKQ